MGKELTNTMLACVAQLGYHRNVADTVLLSGLVWVFLVGLGSLLMGFCLRWFYLDFLGFVVAFLVVFFTIFSH